MAATGCPPPPEPQADLPLAVAGRIRFMGRMTTWITICDTCKREGWEAGPTDGERLAEKVSGEQLDDLFDDWLRLDGKPKGY